MNLFKFIVYYHIYKKKNHTLNLFFLLIGLTDIWRLSKQHKAVLATDKCYGLELKISYFIRMSSSIYI